MKSNVLFIDGIRDDSKVTVSLIDDKGLSYDVGGSCNLFNHINSEYFKKHILVLDANQTSNLNINFNDVHLLVNQVSDFDTHKKVLSKIDVLEDQVLLPIINSAKNIVKTTRDNIYELLNSIDKLKVPKTVRITPLHPKDIIKTIKKENFEFPVILRECGNHGGHMTILLKSKDDLKDFYFFALDGREYYLIQYINYKENNIYRKCRLVVIDGKVYIRHVIYYDDWMIHSSSREFMDENPEYYEKESKIFDNFDTKLKPKLEPIIEKIYEKIGLDFFGIDCAIDKDMNITIFELNANMNILLNTNSYTEKQTKKINEALINMIIEKKRG